MAPAPRLPGFILLLGFGGAFGFGRGLCLPFAAAFVVLWAWGWPFPHARASHLPRFILLISFSDTLLVVSILDIVFDYLLWWLLQS